MKNKFQNFKISSQILLIKSQFIYRLISILIAIIIFKSVIVQAQVPTDGDYRTRISGNWNNAGTWQVRTSSTWYNTSTPPSSTANIYIQTGHALIINVTTADCNNLNINTSGIVTIGSNTVQVSGKIRAYTGSAETSTGADRLFYTQESSTSLVSAMITTSGAGLLKFIGTTRNITVLNEWAAAYTTGFATEFALTSGNTGTLQTGYKTSKITISSGIIDMGSNRLAPDNGTSGQGDVTISSGAILISAASGSSTPVMSRTTTSSSGRAGTLTISGKLILSGPSPYIEFTSYVINAGSTVEFNKSGTQTLIQSSFNSAASFPIYSNLILSGSGTKTLGIVTTVNGTLTLSGTASLSLSTYTLTYDGSSTLEYAGSSSQTSTSAEFPSSSGPNNLKINNSSGVTLSGATTINGTLTFTSGKITLGSNNLTIGSGGSISGATSSSYIVTNGTGKLTINSVGSSEVTFPIGTSTTYNPLYITNTGTVDNFSVKVKAGFTVNPPDPTKAINREWDVAEGTAGGSIAVLKFQFNAADANAGFTFSGAYDVGHYEGSVWIGKPATIIGTSDPYTINVTGMTSFSPFGVGNQGAMPVELSSFTSNVIERNVKLNWTTATEINNSGFEIQKQYQVSSSKYSEWEKVTFVTGNGTKNTPTDYSFNDKKLNTGKYNYRLKQIDYNGNFEYHNLSATVEIGVPKKYDISQNYPNPFNPVTKIDFDLPFDSKVSIRLYDITGREIKILVNETKQAGYYTTDFNGSNISSGTYFYRIVAEGNEQKYIMTKKALLIK
jgi:hypothetical protein